jgi:hypothetical protein
MTTEEIYETYTGDDSAEQVKYCIKDMIETYEVRYVLLIGGRIGQSFRWHVPIRYANVDIDFLDKKILSDVYFADIYKENGEFEDWDSDGDGIIAEWVGLMPDDHIDLIPDVCLGRLPCRNEQEVTDVVNKIIRYEQQDFDQERFNHLLLIGGDTNPGIGDPFPYEGEAESEWITHYMDEFTPTRLYVSEGTLRGPEDFISAFNQGFGFVLYHGHGIQDLLKTYLPDSQEEVLVFHNDYVSDLENEQMQPVMVAGCCLTTNFDVGVFDFLKIFENLEKYHYFRSFKHSCKSRCLGWNLVKHPTAGTIAYIASSSTALGEVGDKNDDSIPDGVQTGYTSGLCTEFFKIYSEDEDLLLGDIYTESLTRIVNEFSAHQFLEQCHCVMVFQLIGDPSLKIGGYP